MKTQLNIHLGRKKIPRSISHPTEKASTEGCRWNAKVKQQSPLGENVCRHLCDSTAAGQHKRKKH